MINQNQVVYLNRNIFSGFLFGLGLVAFLDEAIFHQILHWHHFYDKSTTSIGLISDGIFHVFSWFATVGALFLVADLRRRAFIHNFWKEGDRQVDHRISGPWVLFLQNHKVLLATWLKFKSTWKQDIGTESMKQDKEAACFDETIRCLLLLLFNCKYQATSSSS